ncbi:sulfite exporter TauE/SafE family protein [Agrobacterium larrymoorei]|uniref:Probable membrane transporter protein n=1 Tax=Agrobacterium larrymoorei TaxID=160699 RepID=A0A4D7DN16_9HYPH|nr:sulfite exporter TauE/SafE family protein [Agrobacterium larrymoorei]QCI98365.1 sulfite exporter TauE/SafE family protein [Agrobacterium larrymoorei]QYA06178.1 sulfite exporter TauE/SafE family protein [Agrobacterium larrymoorei]
MFVIYLAVPFGALLGGLGGFLGTGGGTFAIPLLVLMFAYDQKAAQGTALVMVVVNVLYALLKYRSKGSFDFKAALVLSISGSLTSTLSAAWALSLPSETLKWWYGAFLILLAAFVAVTRSKKFVSSSFDYRWMFLPGAIGGVSLGLFGVGGAMLAVPLLVMFFGQSQVKAQGLGLALALPGCSISLIQYGYHDHVDWLVGALFAVGGLLGVPAGVHLAHKVKERTLVLAFCSLLTLAGTLIVAK